MGNGRKVRHSKGRAQPQASAAIEKRNNDRRPRDLFCRRTRHHEDARTNRPAHAKRLLTPATPKHTKQSRRRRRGRCVRCIHVLGTALMGLPSGGNGRTVFVALPYSGHAAFAISARRSILPWSNGDVLTDRSDCDPVKSIPHGKANGGNSDKCNHKRNHPCMATLFVCP